MIIIILEKFNKIKHKTDFSSICSLLVVFISISSIALIFQIIYIKALSNLRIVIIITMLFLTNYTVFYLYDSMIRSITLKKENELITLTNKANLKELDIMKSSTQSLNMLRHDMKNHIITLQSLVKNNDHYDLEEYFKKISYMIEPTNHINTDNLEIDSILNFKLVEAHQNNIIVNTEIRIPQRMNLSGFLMTTILGNLMDNAISATKELDDPRVIDLKIKYDRGRLLIRTKNSFLGKIKHNESGDIISSKSHPQNHGMGILSIKNALLEYNGDMNIDIQYDEHTFIVFITIYI